jgi:hypothetical protein
MSATDHNDGKQIGSLGTLRMLSPTIAFILVSFSLGELVRFIFNNLSRSGCSVDHILFRSLIFSTFDCSVLVHLFPPYKTHQMMIGRRPQHLSRDLFGWHRLERGKCGDGSFLDGLDGVGNANICRRHY